MCKALDEMMEDSRRDGIRIGEKRGEKGVKKMESGGLQRWRKD